MVHLDGGGANTARLDVTAALAQRYDAKVIGIAACEPVRFAGDPYMDGELAVIERDIVTDELARAQTDFEAHEALKPHVLAWRSIPTLDNLTDLIAEHARCADLVITGAEAALGNGSTHADTGALVLRAGRPVLVVPDEAVPAQFKSILVAWADTRECRRAVVDALPLLKDADRITIAQVSDDRPTARAALDDVIAWLGRHGIEADRKISREGRSGTNALAAIAANQNADLIVAGAYGHSRMREWMFGGVTRDLLLRERRCALLAH
jgi:nucleotide-binding universal stress UspA family protein